jgi:hypothetical protein
MRRLLELAAGLLLRRILGQPAAERKATMARTGRGRARAPRPAAAASAETRPEPPGRARGPLVGVMLGSLALGALLMLLFEVWYTRLVGVLALFAFVVCGVAAITGSGLLDPDDEA